MKFLEGKKTIIGMVAFFILGGLKAIGFIDEQTFQILLTVVAGWTAYGIHSAVVRK